MPVLKPGLLVAFHAVDGCGSLARSCSCDCCVFCWHFDKHLVGNSMASSAIKPGKLVALQELEPSSPFFKQGESLRVTGKLQKHSVENDIAIIVEGGVTLKVDTQHLSDIGFRVGSIYQFIGELLLQPENDPVLRARVGRNVDGIDLQLYYQSMKLRRQFEADIMKSRLT